MSSHHVVREKQEPALLALGLDNLDEELLGQLLEWSPTVIATSQTAEKLNSLGIKIDWIITDSLQEIDQSDIKIMRANGNNPGDAALENLIAREYPSVNILTDIFNLNDYLPYANKINLVIFNNGKRIFPVLPGFSKWKPVAETIAILSPAADVQISGLNKVDDNHYETIRNGIFSLNFKEPFLFIAEDL